MSDPTLVCTPTEFLAAPPAERVKLVLAQIDATPELWDQGVWMAHTQCGTTACVAGWACLLAGADPTEELSWEDTYVRLGDRTEDVPVLAAELLGLSGAQAEALFWETNTREDLDMVLAGDLTAPRRRLRRRAVRLT
jgi:hypothetical protein